ncbi:MAG TPA: ROK family transcriptional regulator [Vicinamibacterales bacterium]|jgi:predicted NBD/HSP70 family sugar kinase|nr:ROK family transcriptional regulator [Vicinamibacterales bacterium]
MTPRRFGQSHLSGSNLQRAGDHNQRVTLHAVRVNGPITRVELAAITGLTAPTIANITKRLLSDGLIQEAGRRRGGRGQPATKLVINPDSLFSIGLNVDRDHITLVVLDFAGQVRARASREIAFAMPSDVEKFFKERVRKLLAQVDAGSEKLAGIGVASPDDMPHAATLPHQPANYNIWATTNIPALLQKTLHVPVFVENDAAAATIGEMQFGLGKKYQTFFYILITAALGGSIVMEGHHYRGASGRSGELGLLEGRDPSGRERQIQEIVSLSALFGRLSAQGIVVSSPQELMRLDERGRAIVDVWTEDAVDTLLSPVISINCLFNPQAILIGGRLPADIVDNLATRLNQKLHSFSAKVPAIAPVSRAALSDDAPAVGAAILPFSDRLLPTRTALMKVAAL